MRSPTIIVVKAIIAVCLAGSLVVQTVMVPLIWTDLEGEVLWGRIWIVATIVLGVVCLQVFAVCVWRLLGLVRAGTVFSPRAFRYVDVIIGAIVAAAVLVFALAVVLAPGQMAPGIVALICGAAVALAGIALLVTVMRRLLAQAIALDAEAGALRDELGEVI
jgi:hypothetical protein